MEEYTASVGPKVLQELYNIAMSDPIRLLVHGYEEQQVLQELQVGAEGVLGKVHGRSGSPALHLELGEESDEPLERPDAGQTLLCHRLAESRNSSEVYASLLQTYGAATQHASQRCREGPQRGLGAFVSYWPASLQSSGHCNTSRALRHRFDATQGKPRTVGGDGFMTCYEV